MHQRANHEGGQHEGQGQHQSQSLKHQRQSDEQRSPRHLAIMHA